MKNKLYAKIFAKMFKLLCAVLAFGMVLSTSSFAKTNIEKKIDEREKMLSEIDKKLFQAIEDNDPSEISFLFLKGANVGARDGDLDSFLHAAVRTGDIPTIKAVLAGENKEKIGVPIESINECDETPFSLAVYGHDKKIVELLFEEAAEKGVEIDLDNIDKFYESPLYYAACAGDMDLINILLNEGAKVKIEEEKNPSLEQKLLNEKLKKAEAAGKSPLIGALKNYQTNVAEFLIDKGADVMVTDECGNTTADLSAKSRATKLTERLIEKGAKITPTKYQYPTAKLQTPTRAEEAKGYGYGNGTFASVTSSSAGNINLDGLESIKVLASVMPIPGIGGVLETLANMISPTDEQKKEEAKVLAKAKKQEGGPVNYKEIALAFAKEGNLPGLEMLAVEMKAKIDPKTIAGIYASVFKAVSAQKDIKNNPVQDWLQNQLCGDKEKCFADVVKPNDVKGKKGNTEKA